MRKLALALMAVAIGGTLTSSADSKPEKDASILAVPRIAARYPKKKDGVFYQTNWVSYFQNWYDFTEPNTISIETVPAASPADLAQWEQAQAAGTIKPDAQFRLALEMARTGNYLRAIDLLNARIAVVPQEYPSLTLRAAVYSKLGRHDYAIEDLKVADAWQQHFWSAPVGVSGDAYLQRQLMTNVAIANEYIAMGRMKDKDFTSALQTARYNYRSQRGFRALELAMNRLEAALTAIQSGVDPAQLTATNVAVETAPQECIPTAIYEEALAKSYRAPEARLRLLQVHELCGAFDKATALRAAHPDLAVQRPFAERRWKIECATGRPDMLQRALDAGYQVRDVGERIGKFYEGCGRPAEGITAWQKSYATFDPAHLKDASEFLSFDEIGKALARAYAATGNGLAAIETMQSVLDAAPRFYALNSDVYGFILDDARTLTLAVLRQSSGNVEIAARAQQVLDRIRQRNGQVTADNAARAADAKRCEQLFDVATAMMDRTEVQNQSNPPSTIVHNWTMTCNAVHDLAVEAGQRKCEPGIRRDLTRLGNLAYAKGKSYADNWKKQYLEDLHMGCFAMPVL